MKKQYIRPGVTVVRLEIQQLIAQSPLTTSGLDGVTNGGNTSGQDADARITVPNAWEEW